MNSAKKAEKTSDTRYPVIIADDGQKYVDPLESGGKYLVRKYDVPELNDLEAFRGMLKDFEQRFLRNVSRGESVARTSPNKLDEYIEKERTGLNEVRQKLDADPSNDKLQAEESVVKRWLATAILARAMRLSKYHIKLRTSDVTDTQQLDEIKDRMINEAKEQAKAEANKIISDAQVQIQQQKNAALTEVKNEIGNLAVEVAGRILRQELSSTKGQEAYMSLLSEDIKLN